MKTYTVLKKKKHFYDDEEFVETELVAVCESLDCADAIVQKMMRKDGVGINDCFLATSTNDERIVKAYSCSKFTFEIMETEVLKEREALLESMVDEFRKSLDRMSNKELDEMLEQVRPFAAKSPEVGEYLSLMEKMRKG